MADIVAGMDTGTQVSDKTLQFESADTIVGVTVGEARLNSGGVRVDLHRFVFISRLRLIHVAHDPVSGPLQVSFALTKSTGPLSICEAH